LLLQKQETTVALSRWEALNRESEAEVPPVRLPHPCLQRALPALTLAAAATTTAFAAPGVTLSTTHLEYGNQLLGQRTAAQTLTITNSGDSPLAIQTVSLVGADPRQFVIGSDTGEAVLASGASRQVGIQFRPLSDGFWGAGLAVFSNAPGSPHLVTLTGTGVTTFANRSPSSLDFGNRQIGRQTVDQVVMIRNDGSTQLAIGQMGIYGTGAAAFSTNVFDCKNTSLAPGETCRVTVTFQPATVGTHEAYLVMHDSAPFSPHLVSLRGVGINSPPVPLAPTGLSARAILSTQIHLIWTDTSGNESGFELQRRTYSGAWVTIATLPVNSTSYTDTGLTPSELYIYRVRSFNAGGPSQNWSNQAWTEASVLPKAPSGLAASPVSSTRVTLAWTDNSTNETAFAVFRKEGAGVWSRIGVTAPNTVAYADTSVTGGRTYTYRVRATNNEGASAWSNEVTVVTPSSP
jgi:hypothetical protein